MNNENKLEKIILEYLENDGCTYSFRQTFPILYESTEKFLLDFEELCLTSFKNHINEFIIGGCTFRTNDFILDYNAQVNLPSIMSIDEWFAMHNKINN